MTVRAVKPHVVGTLSADFASNWVGIFSSTGLAEGPSKNPPRQHRTATQHIGRVLVRNGPKDLRTWNKPEEYELGIPPRSLGTAVDEAHEFIDADAQEPTHPAAESVYTDDPVRVYLREMGSVRLLNRQDEVDLARQMERGKLRMHKALSRSPLVVGSTYWGFTGRYTKGRGSIGRFCRTSGRPTMPSGSVRAKRGGTLVP